MRRRQRVVGATACAERSLRRGRPARAPPRRWPRGSADRAPRAARSSPAWLDADPATRARDLRPVYRRLPDRRRPGIREVKALDTRQTSSAPRRHACGAADGGGAVCLCLLPRHRAAVTAEASDALLLARRRAAATAIDGLKRAPRAARLRRPDRRAPAAAAAATAARPGCCTSSTAASITS